MVLIAVVCLLGSAPTAGAQDATLGEVEYWARLRETGGLLQQARGQSAAGQETVLAQVRGLWAGIDAVRLADATVVAVDMRWLAGELTPGTLDDAQTRLQALLQYHEQRASQAVLDAEARLKALNKVQIDYPEPTPTVTAEPWVRPDLPGRGIDLSPSPGLSQVILFAAAVLVVTAVLVSLARGLRIQRAGVGAEAGDADNAPTTSEAARERAASSETVRDYRAAIRYLYLSSLLLLDERGVIRYDPTLTNREHLQQAAGSPRLADLLRPVVSTFDYVWYGFAPADAKLYEEFSRSVDRLRQLAP
ncbi:MAG: DUF4129 domain-containing protein [Anaerolineae bacterium]|nr:DUF4129 domain-containing protein [Anaerolineae bacterium]